jgi:hypothetical protein
MNKNFTVEDVKIPDNEMLNKILKSKTSTISSRGRCKAINLLNRYPKKRGLS